MKTFKIFSHKWHKHCVLFLTWIFACCKSETILWLYFVKENSIDVNVIIVCSLIKRTFSFNCERILHFLVYVITSMIFERRVGLMVSAFDSRVSTKVSSPVWGHSVVFLDKTIYSHCLSQPKSINGYRWIYCWGLTQRWTSIPSRGE